MNAVTPEQRVLLAKLASISEMVEQDKTTICLLEHERLTLQYRLRLAGYRAPTVPK